MDDTRPSWQTSECPPWCEREHQEDDRDGDRSHQIDGVWVPVIRLVREYPRDREPVRYLVADTVVVGAFQAQDESRPTVYVGLQDDARVSIEVRDESADRLSDALRQVVERVTK